jgi:inorganic phosphate transporter, PiT family
VSTEPVGTAVVIVFAVAYSYTNGFHDAATAIATSVSTRALTPRLALPMAAVGNLIGSFLGGRVADTVGTGIVRLPGGRGSLGVVVAGLVGAIGWNLVTWYLGVPSSSSHALFGGLVGATLLGSGAAVQWRGVVHNVLVPMVLSPAVGLVLGFLVLLGVLWGFRRGHPGRLVRGFRRAQAVSTLAMSVGHGMQDASKTVGVVLLGLTVGGYGGAARHQWWVSVLTALVLALGTYSGGWRIIRTPGRRVVHLDPPQGVAAETTASAVLYTATAYGLPVSTTHTIAATIAGVGATRRLSAVRWAVAGNIGVAWLLTFPAAAGIAAVVYLVIRPLFG